MNIGIAWYESEDDYKAVLGLFPAVETKGAMSYSEVITRTQTFEKRFIAEGQSPMRVPVKAVAFQAWCKTHNVPLKWENVGKYAMFLAGMNTLGGGN